MTASDPWGSPTQWSLVHDANDSQDPAAREVAWSGLVDRYRDAVRASVAARCRGRWDVDEISEDFFTYIFEQKLLDKVDPDKGRFRQFMNGVLRRYVSQRTRVRGAQGRGGTGEDDVTLDPAAPTDLSLSGRLEEQRWAAGVLQRSIQRLIDPDKYPRNGILLLRTYGIDPYEAMPRAELREEFAMTVGAFDEALAAARRSLREHLRAEVVESAAQLEGPSDAADDLVHRLLGAFPGLDASS